MIYCIFLIAAALAALSCGVEEPQQESAQIPEVPSYELIAVDSIGVETGDSTYMFGSIEGLSYASDGSIVLLDRAFSRIMVYSLDGEFIRQIGREGNGPGEMSLTVLMALTGNGDLLISQRDAMEHFIFSSGEWITEYPRGETPPPFVLRGMPDSKFVGVHMDLLPGDGTFVAAVILGIYEPGNNEPVTVLEEHSVEINPMNAAFLFENVIDAYSETVGSEGTVYVASRSGTEYEVTGFNHEGEKVFELLRDDIEPVEMTEEELQEEKDFMEARLLSMGSGEQRCSPDPVLPMINGLGTDIEGNLWVRRGNLPDPFFDVYNTSGERLRTVSLQVEPGQGRYWNISVQPGGLLAYSANPSEGYQKVYILDIR